MAVPNIRTKDVEASSSAEVPDEVPAGGCPSHRLGTDARALLIGDIVMAVDRKDFRLEYQPIFGVTDREVHGVEALLRWGARPGRPNYSPAEFIPVAEQTGLIVPLGAWVFERALADWTAVDPKHGITLNVNVSARQLAAPDFVMSVSAMLLASGVSPQRIGFEITETLAIRDFDRAARVVSDVRALGCKVGMDDFGTGYSSLACLHRLQLDFIKIDQSFVQAMGEQSCADALVAATIALARELNLEVVAEGVETNEQLRRLDVLGCRYAQGHYLSRPRASLRSLDLL